MRPVALVTGASSGIGRGIAVGLAQAGHDVIINYVPPLEPAEQTRTEVEAAGAATLLVEADVSSPEDRQRLLQKTLDRFGRLDLLVSNAGISVKSRGDMLASDDEADFDRVIGVNVKGPYFLALAAANAMIDLRERGVVPTPRIVFVTSISAWSVSPGRAPYCISKAALHMTAQCFAVRLAPEGIPVFEIAPGIIDTPMIAPVRDKYIQRIADGLVPQDRLGTPEDVAKVVVAISRGEMDFSTGQVLHVDGGLSILQL